MVFSWSVGVAVSPRQMQFSQNIPRGGSHGQDWNQRKATSDRRPITDLFWDTKFFWTAQLSVVSNGCPFASV
jgi:hypothetical protein